MKAFLLFLFLSFQVKAGLVNNFEERLKDKCRINSSLLIKKALLELAVKRNGTFSKKVLRICPKLDYERLQEIFLEARNEGSGSVIGQ